MWFRGPCCDWGAPGTAERKHRGQMEALCAETGSDQCGNRDHWARLLPRWSARDGAPDAGALENEGGKHRLHNREALSSSGRQHKGRRNPENIGLLRFLPLDLINFGRFASLNDFLSVLAKCNLSNQNKQKMFWFYVPQVNKWNFKIMFIVK